MKKRRMAFALIGLCSLLLVLSPIAQASKVEFGLDFLISGDQPNGTKPWLSAVFEDAPPSSPGGVYLTMGAGGLTGSTQFISDWYFNLDSNSIKLLKFDYLGYPINEGPPAFGILFKNGDPGKSFNLQFSFFTANTDKSRFDAGEFVTYLIQGDGLTASLFDFANNDGYFTMAHVQGIDGKEGLGSIGKKNDVQPAPEPATMLLLGIGLTGLVFFDRKKFFK